MKTIIVKATPDEITHETVSNDMPFDSFVEHVSFRNFGKDIIIDDLVDVFVPDTNARYKLIVV